MKKKIEVKHYCVTRDLIRREKAQGNKSPSPTLSVGMSFGLETASVMAEECYAGNNFTGRCCTVFFTSSKLSVKCWPAHHRVWPQTWCSADCKTKPGLERVGLPLYQASWWPEWATGVESPGLHQRFGRSILFQYTGRCIPITNNQALLKPASQPEGAIPFCI